jgi:hypothetical protein
MARPRRPAVTPRKSPRPLEDIDTKLRELEPTRLRLFKPLTGVPNTPDENAVYEYGRLVALNFFGALSKRDLDTAKKELEVETEEQENIAGGVSLVYKYLEYQNRRDFAGIIDIHHNPYLNKTYFGRWPISPEAHTRGLRGFFKITPDATTELNKIFLAAATTPSARGPVRRGARTAITNANAKIVIRTTARGTQVQDFPGSMLGLGGKQWAVTLIHTIDVVDGLIASCEGVSPFENQWEEAFVNSSFPGLGGDVAEVRARQGVNADFEYLAEQVIGDDTIARMYAGGAKPLSLSVEHDDVLAMIQELHRQAPNQCQTLIAPKMRRCSKMSVGDSLYCLYHQEHGYGID